MKIMISQKRPLCASGDIGLIAIAILKRPTKMAVLMFLL
jgi:hypothetical protein